VTAESAHRPRSPRRNASGAAPDEQRRWIRERLAGKPLAPGLEASDAELREWIAGTFSLEY